ncbi:DNA-binding MarR family transcriptional regulator [Allocatelliglobosispora scoriae]|uniref:DNA-binding MarR family transcriptional regulator n=1 Tax=Allocatelliglobosispora scoriae TaxID=643052 RepID=A0A841C015_9ACTN|nr:MarR family transcriptional regulator [Allocatelliglobosispora scoriae]MBB5872382.1 DNA-binding MarR family transcriptional regulator [Allocatelliglobosispora scoriae]
MGLSQPDLMQLLTRAERLLARRVAEIVADEGHTIDGWRVISLLADGAGHPMTAIADQVFLPPGTLTKLVDHLVEHNLVHRKVDPEDRRRIRAYLTPRGRAMHERVDARVQASIAGLSADDAHLRSLLAGLVEAMEQRPALV